MRVFRLTRARYPGFDGRGSLLASGRWNNAGVRMVYTSGSRALAALETLVHLRKDQLPSDYVFFVADIPDVVIEAPPAAGLPPDWRYAHPLQARVFGSEWARAARSLVLTVPSIVIPEEPNYLLNPEHSAFAHIRVTGPEQFQFDPRLLK